MRRPYMISYTRLIQLEALSATIWAPNIKIAILTFKGHLRSTSRSPMRRLYMISYTCLIQLEALTATIWAPNIKIASLTFKGHLRSRSRSPMWRPYMISYTCLIQLEALSATVWAPGINGNQNRLGPWATMATKIVWARELPIPNVHTKYENNRNKIATCRAFTSYVLNMAKFQY